MEFIFKSKNIELDDRIRNYAEKKIKNKIVRILDNVINIEMKFIYEKNPRINLDNKVEVTVFTPGSTIRATDSGSDVYEAIDKVSSKLERLIKKYKEKLVSRGRKSEGRKEFAGIGKDIEFEKDDSSKIRDSIVKVKTFDIKPIPPEEAILQMEMLGHDFFVFINSESGKTAVIYRRKDKNYGLIEPSL